MSYTTIKLPDDFVKKYVDPFVSAQGEGYTSRAEVIKEAIRQYVKGKEILEVDN